MTRRVFAVNKRGVIAVPLPDEPPNRERPEPVHRASLRPDESVQPLPGTGLQAQAWRSASASLPARTPHVVFRHGRAAGTHLGGTAVPMMPRSIRLGHPTTPRYGG